MWSDSCDYNSTLWWRLSWSPDLVLHQSRLHQVPGMSMTGFQRQKTNVFHRRVTCRPSVKLILTSQLSRSNGLPSKDIFWSSNCTWRRNNKLFGHQDINKVSNNFASVVNEVVLNTLWPQISIRNIKYQNRMAECYAELTSPECEPCENNLFGMDFRE